MVRRRPASRVVRHAAAVSSSPSPSSPSGRSPDRASLVQLERRGHREVDAVVASAREVPWALNVLQLLWTAGPVVFLAIQGGHYLGFGTAAQPRNVLFFAVYTFLFGAIGLVARFAATTVRERRQQRARRALTQVLDLLPDLIFTVRDVALGQLPAEARRREAAQILLRKADLGPEGVALGVEELTGDAVLAEAAKRIEMFRRLGLYSRVQELLEAAAERRAAALANLHAVAPEAAELLRDRLAGRAPSLEEGVPRGEGFLERILAAADGDEPQIMSLSDVEDLLTLTLELVSGREILRLTFDYSGDWRVARALDEVEAAQNRYRMAQGAALSHLQSLATYLVDSGLTGLGEEELSLPAQALLERVLTALQVLVLVAPVDHAEAVRRAVQQARRVRRAVEQTAAERERYVKALGRWQALRERAPGGEPLGRGLRVRERWIRLGHEQKLQVAAALSDYLQELKIDAGPRGATRAGRGFSAADARRLAVRLSLILGPVLDFGDASVQRAIETSNAPYFHGLEIDFSADAKAGLAAAVAKEVRQDVARMAERLALRLSRVYRVPLSAGVIGFLADNYGANRERLELIASAAAGEDGPHFSPPAPALRIDAQRWRRLLQQGERQR